MKVLHGSICEEKVLFTLFFEEQDNAGIVRQMKEVIGNSRIPQERVAEPFTRPHLSSTRKVVLGLHSLLRTPARVTSQPPHEHFIFL